MAGRTVEIQTYIDGKAVGVGLVPYNIRYIILGDDNAVKEKRE